MATKPQNLHGFIARMGPVGRLSQAWRTREHCMSEHKATVRRVLEESLRLNTSDLGDADPIFSAGLIDSFALLELITVLESTFGIRITAEKATIENLDSIEGISGLIDTCS